MKVAILNIGYRTFAFSKPGDAAKVLELLGKSVEVESTLKDCRQFWSPRTDGELSADLQMQLVDADRLLRPPKTVPESRRLGYTPTLDAPQS